MAKKSFKTAPKPSNPQLDKAIDSFVETGPGKDETKVQSAPPAANAPPAEQPEQSEPLKKLSVELPESLKHEYKVLCAQHQLKIKDDIEGLIAKRVKQLRAE